MTHRTLVLSSIESYLACGNDSPEDIRERDELLLRFPYTVMLEVAFPELDFINRWCWLHFGPMDGECLEKYSEYRSCAEDTPHQHTGKWTSHWFVKTEYDFGFNEWHFSEEADRDLLLTSLPDMNWGEHYPK